MLKLDGFSMRASGVCFSILSHIATVYKLLSFGCISKALAQGVWAVCCVVPVFSYHQYV